MINGLPPFLGPENEKPGSIEPGCRRKILDTLQLDLERVGHEIQERHNDKTGQR
jgi:hypothetical protein